MATPFPCPCRVKIVGLNRRADLNGRYGAAESYDAVHDAYAVRLDGLDGGSRSTTLNVRAANALRAEGAPWPMPAQFRVVGLSARPELNGKVAIAYSFDTASGRYALSFDQRLPIGLRPERLVWMPAREEVCDHIYYCWNGHRFCSAHRFEACKTCGMDCAADNRLMPILACAPYTTEMNERTLAEVDRERTQRTATRRPPQPDGLSVAGGGGARGRHNRQLEVASEFLAPRGVDPSALQAWSAGKGSLCAAFASDLACAQRYGSEGLSSVTTSLRDQSSSDSIQSASRVMSTLLECLVSAAAGARLDAPMRFTIQPSSKSLRVVVDVLRAYRLPLPADRPLVLVRFLTDMRFYQPAGPAEEADAAAVPAARCRALDVDEEPLLLLDSLLTRAAERLAPAWLGSAEAVAALRFLSDGWRLSALTPMVFAPAKPCARCGYCGAEGASKKCARCAVAKYCGAECQHAHWPAHKPCCVKLDDLETSAAASHVSVDLARVRALAASEGCSGSSMLDLFAAASVKLSGLRVGRPEVFKVQRPLRPGALAPLPEGESMLCYNRARNVHFSIVPSVCADWARLWRYVFERGHTGALHDGSSVGGLKVYVRGVAIDTPDGGQTLKLLLPETALPAESW